MLRILFNREPIQDISASSIQTFTEAIIVFKLISKRNISYSQLKWYKRFCSQIIVIFIGENLKIKNYLKIYKKDRNSLPWNELFFFPSISLTVQLIITHIILT